MIITGYGDYFAKGSNFGQAFQREAPQDEVSRREALLDQIESDAKRDLINPWEEKRDEPPAEPQLTAQEQRETGCLVPVPQASSAPSAAQRDLIDPWKQQPASIKAVQVLAIGAVVGLAIWLLR